MLWGGGQFGDVHLVFRLAPQDREVLRRGNVVSVPEFANIYPVQGSGKRSGLVRLSPRRGKRVVPRVFAPCQ